MSTSKQREVDRVRTVQEALGELGREGILVLTPEQRAGFDAWAAATLERLDAGADVSLSAEEKRVSWGMRIVSTLGGLAICAAVVLFFQRFWGYLTTPAQLAILAALPLAMLAVTEVVGEREKGRYFTGLLAIVALASFIMNVSVAGEIFNMPPSAGALLPWALFALLLAYRYGLRLMLAAGIVIGAGFVCSSALQLLRNPAFDFHQQPEALALCGLAAFAVPLAVRHGKNEDFPAVYRLCGAVIWFLSVLFLAASGYSQHFHWRRETVQLTFEIAGLVTGAGGVWLGIRRGWDGVVNAAAAAFAVFLYMRLYRLLWDWIPSYLFFALLGALAIGLLVVFQRIRRRMREGGAA